MTCSTADSPILPREIYLKDNTATASHSSDSKEKAHDFIARIPIPDDLISEKLFMLLRATFQCSFS